MDAPQTRKWRAWLDLQPGAEQQLHVTGEVQVSATSKEPVLTRSQPQGINPAILILDLSIRKSASATRSSHGRRRPTWRWASLPASTTQVDIRWETAIIATINEIEEVH